MGADYPFVLRSLEGKTDPQVIGPCYISGLMSGEALLGPLPSNQKRVGKIISNAICNCFLNDRTGQIIYEDPRLGPLPKEWRRESYGREDWEIKYVNEEAGERRYIDSDPRLTSKALKERGIKIEDIIFV